MKCFKSRELCTEGSRPCRVWLKTRTAEEQRSKRCGACPLCALCCVRGPEALGFPRGPSETNGTCISEACRKTVCKLFPSAFLQKAAKSVRAQKVREIVKKFGNRRETIHVDPWEHTTISVRFFWHFFTSCALQNLQTSQATLAWFHFLVAVWLPC